MDYDKVSEGPSPSGGCGTSPVDPEFNRLRGAGTISGAAQPGQYYAGRNEARERVNRLSLADEPQAAVPNLRERVYHACRRGEEAARKYNRALRCAQLMEAHPEVAELVELLREF